MWSILAAILLFIPLFIPLSSSNTSKGLFTNDHVIFTSKGEITKLFVQADDNKFLQGDSTDLPSIFFTVVAPHFEGGSCIYVLEDLAAYEILEGGRDSTADYGSDRNVYFGAKDGVYKYYKDSLSARRFGLFKDDIIQIQKANGTDKIYYLTDEKKLFTLESNGTVKTKVRGVLCADQFVLDTSNNLYFVECKTNSVFIQRAKKELPEVVPEEFSDVKLFRPAFIMDDCIPLLGDGRLYILYVNGTVELKDFFVEENVTAVSVDTALYMVVAFNGKIYEYNLLDVMLKSLYGLGSPSAQDVNKVVMSVINFKDIFGFSSKIPK